MERVEIRSLQARERETWAALEATWCGGTPLTANAHRPDPAWLWLGAWRGERCVGRLRAVRPQTELVTFDEVTVAPDEDPDAIAAAMVRALASRLDDGRTRLYVEENDADLPLRRWVEMAGCVHARTKVVVMRSLPFEGRVDLAPYTLHTLAEIGEVAFARTLEVASEGDPFEPEGPHDARAELDALVAYAGDDFDAQVWIVLRNGERDVGVVLPQRFADDPGAGSIFYVGVTPTYRGRGIGRRLHAYGLRTLGMRGARRYMGSTEERNEPMRRIFAKNGCREVARQLFFAPA